MIKFSYASRASNRKKETILHLNIVADMSSLIFGSGQGGGGMIQTWGKVVKIEIEDKDQAMLTIKLTGEFHVFIDRWLMKKKKIDIGKSIPVKITETGVDVDEDILIPRDLRVEEL